MQVKKPIKYGKCNKLFSNIREHRIRYKTYYEGVSELKLYAWDNSNDAPWVEDGNINYEFKKCCEKYDAYARYNNEIGSDVFETYNFPSNNLGGGV